MRRILLIAVCLAGGCRTATPAESLASTFAPTRADAPEHPPAAEPDPGELVGISAYGDRTCAWTRGGLAACTREDRVEPIPLDGVTSVTLRTEGWCATTKTGRVFCGDDRGRIEYLDDLRGVTDLTCSMHFCAGLLHGELRTFTSVFWQAKSHPNGEGLTAISMRNSAVLGLRPDGEVRRFDVTGPSQGDALAHSASAIVSDCHVSDGMMLCGEAAEVAVPEGFTPTASVGHVRHFQEKTLVRQVCGHNGGLVRCFGATLGRPPDPADPGRWWNVPTINDAKVVVGGNRHACVLTQGGRVRCWGGFDRGQYGFRHERHVPVLVEDTGVTDGDASVLAGSIRSCVLSPSASACTSVETHRWTDREAAKVSHVGRDNDFYIVQEDRTLHLRGGDPDAVGRTKLPWGASSVRRHLDCNSEAYFLFDDGTVGSVDNWQVFRDEDTDELPPLQPIPRDRTWKNATDIACSRNGLCTLDTSGDVHCPGHYNSTPRRWFAGASAMVMADGIVCATVGSKNECQLYNSNIKRGTFEPKALRGLEDLVARDDRICGRLGDTIIRCAWPAENLGTEDATVEAVDFPGTVATYSLGQEHACARLDDGRTLCWGVASHYRLGAAYIHAEPVDVTDRFTEVMR